VLLRFPGGIRPRARARVLGRKSPACDLRGRRTGDECYFLAWRCQRGSARNRRAGHKGRGSAVSNRSGL